MAFHLRLTLNRKSVTLSGIVGLLALIGFLGLPLLLVPKLTAERAEFEIRKCLRSQLGQSQVAELKAVGLNVPDPNMAARWKTDFDHLDRLEFESLKIRRSLFASPLSSSRVFVVKATLHEPGQATETHYFVLSADGKPFDFFWTVERPRWVWFFAV